MEEIIVELDNTHSVGLGDHLCLLSAMAKLRPKVWLHVNNDHNTYNRLTQYCKIFRIPRSCLEIKQIDHNGNFDNTGWPIKIFTDYYKTDIVNTNGILTKINTRGKQYIALVTASESDPTGKNEWPWSRNRPPEYWAKIFSWAKSLGYEVITLDHPFFDLETKIEFLAKHCCAMITYEGGMAHLAHMMDMPCYIVDWQHPSSSTTLNVFHVDFVHMTNSVYIMRDDTKIFSWDRTQFDVITEQLRNGHGNNRFVNKDFYFNFVGPDFLNDLRIYNKNELLCLQTPSFFGRGYAEFLHKYYQNV
jgi:hypothetical protein